MDILCFTALQLQYIKKQERTFNRDVFVPKYGNISGPSLCPHIKQSLLSLKAPLQIVISKIASSKPNEEPTWVLVKF